MPYYVPLGVRGLILHAGSWLTVLLGSSVYWLATWRRGRAMGPAAAAPTPTPSLIA